MVDPLYRGDVVPITALFPAIFMTVMLWILQNTVIPLCCSLYASVIVVRYINFSELRAEASEVVNVTRTNYFLYSYRGKEGFERARPRVPGQPDPLLHFGNLRRLMSRFEERGHTKAARQLEWMEAVLMHEFDECIDISLLTKEDRDKRIMDKMMQEKQLPDLKPSILALFTLFRWNI